MLIAERPKLEKLIVKGKWDGKNYVVAEDWSLLFKNDRVRIDMEILTGFITDGGSIPWWYRWRLNPIGRYLRQYVGHDGFYATECLTRSEADWVFLEMLEDDDANWAIRNEIWTAVRVGGRSVWAEHTDETISAARELVKCEYKLLST